MSLLPAAPGAWRRPVRAMREREANRMVCGMLADDAVVEKVRLLLGWGMMDVTEAEYQVRGKRISREVAEEFRAAARRGRREP